MNIENYKHDLAHKDKIMKELEKLKKNKTGIEKLWEIWMLVAEKSKKCLTTKEKKRLAGK